MLKTRAQLKKLFFDSPRVVGAVDDATRRVLSRFGAYVRRTAQCSIRTRKGASAPGEPPHSHSGHLRKFISFWYDPAARSVVIGPEKLNKVQFDGRLQAGGATVPELLEYGGTGGVVEEAFRLPDGRIVWERRNLKRAGSIRLLATLRMRLESGHSMAGLGGTMVVPAGHHRFRTYRMAARPYMGPAFAKEKAKLPALWANSVKAR
jgi:hypothetical protein